MTSAYRTHRERFELMARRRRLAAEWVRVEDAPCESAIEHPTLVFLHEGLGCIGFWRSFPDALCARLKLRGLLYDRCGYGASDPLDRPRTPHYLHEEALDFLPDVLEATGVGRPVLVGHSDGGSIALIFAGAHPGRCAAIVTEAAHVFVEPETLAGIRAAEALWTEGPLRRALECHHAAKAGTVFRAWADTWCAPGFAAWNIEAELTAIRVPLLALQGCDDEYGTRAQLGAIVGRVRGPVEAHLIARCAHVPHHQARDLVLDLMEAFLRRQLPAELAPRFPSRGGVACRPPAHP